MKWSRRDTGLDIPEISSLGLISQNHFPFWQWEAKTSKKKPLAMMSFQNLSALCTQLPPCGWSGNSPWLASGVRSKLSQITNRVERRLSGSQRIEKLWDSVLSPVGSQRPSGLTSSLHTEKPSIQESTARSWVERLPDLVCLQAGPTSKWLQGPRESDPSPTDPQFPSVKWSRAWQNSLFQSCQAKSLRSTLPLETTKNAGKLV